MPRLAFAPLLGIWLCVFCGPTGAAPTPPPARLSEVLLIGEWDFGWGGTDGGQMNLHKNGTYSTSRDGHLVYTGLWWVDRGELVLIEWTCGPEGAACGPIRYALALDPRTFAGRSGSGVAVRLSKPTRP